MSVWKEIDRLKAKYDADFARVKRLVKELGGGSVKTDEFGFWRCSWRPTFGDRRVVRVRAQRPAELLRALRRTRRELRAAHAAAKAKAAQVEAAAG